MDTLIPGSGFLGLLLPVIQRKIGPRVRIVNPSDYLMQAISARLSTDEDLKRNMGVCSDMKLLATDVSERISQPEHCFLKAAQI